MTSVKGLERDASQKQMIVLISCASVTVTKGTVQITYQAVLVIDVLSAQRCMKMWPLNIRSQLLTVNQNHQKIK